MPLKSPHPRYIVVDAGPLVALINDADDEHDAVLAWYDVLSSRTRLIVPVPVITEVCHLLDRRLGPDIETAFVERLVDAVICCGSPHRAGRSCGGWPS